MFELLWCLLPGQVHCGGVQPWVRALTRILEMLKNPGGAHLGAFRNVPAGTVDYSLLLGTHRR